MADLITQFPRSQTLAEAQPDLNENFNNINDIWGINHIDLITVLNSGMHSQIDLTSKTSVNAGVTSQIQLQNVPDALGNLILYFIKSTTATGMITKTFITPGMDTICVKLPSGIIIKWSYIVGTVIPGDRGIITVPWALLTNNGQDDIPFTTQYWANVVLGTTGFSGDNRAWAYVEDFSIPTQITYRVWQRTSFNTLPPTQDCAINFMAIGV